MHTLGICSVTNLVWKGKHGRRNEQKKGRHPCLYRGSSIKNNARMMRKHNVVTCVRTYENTT